MSTSSKKRRFHVLVVQWTSKKCTKSVKHVQCRCFTHNTNRFFSPCRCRRRRGCLSSLPTVSIYTRFRELLVIPTWFGGGWLWRLGPWSLMTFLFVWRALFLSVLFLRLRWFLQKHNVVIQNNTFKLMGIAEYLLEMNWINSELCTRKVHV